MIYTSLSFNSKFLLESPTFFLIIQGSKAYTCCVLLFFRKFPLMIIPAKSLIPNYAIFQPALQAEGHYNYLAI